MKLAMTRKGAIVALTLASLLALAIALTGCGSGGTGASSSASSSTTSQQGSTTSMDNASSKTLVVYFSASGNTEHVAQEIASTLNADTFVIEPTDPYTEADLNWRDESSRVNAEHDDEAMRDIPLRQVTPDNFADYDTVFIGYPIWWGIAAWPVDGFVAGNDFTGKTVIPFCTSTSSGLGESATLLEQLTRTGTWEEGHRFASSPTDEEIQSWLASLGD